MTKKEMVWYLIGPIVMSFTFAITSPIIHIYFTSLISPRVMAIANLLNTALAAITNYSIKYDTLKRLYRTYFHWIVYIDIFIFITVSIFGIDYPEVRFIGFAVLNAVSTCLWVMIMKNVVNIIIKDGDSRTDFEALTQSTCLCANCIGSILAVIFVDIPVECCVIAQCCANAFMGYTDLHAFNLLQPKVKVRLGQKFHA